MVTVHFVLLVLAFACFVAAAAGVTFGRVALLPAGLALWVLALLLGSRLLVP
jgi:hypothetical protein